jgi:hypothetical protein
LSRIVSNSMAAPRFYAAALGTCAGVALALAAIGLYGLLAYSVAQRTRETGVCMALGAPRRGILALVLGQGAVLAAIGVAAGLAGAFAVTRYLSSLLFGITPLDPATFVAVALVFAGVALLASYVPARRARIARVSRRACIDRAAAPPTVVLRDVRSHVDLAYLVDEVDRVIGFVGSDGTMPRRRKTPMRTEHRRRRLALSEPVGDARLRIDDQPVTVLHQEVPKIRQARFRVVRLPIQPRIGIGRRRMRIVLPILPPEVAPIAIRCRHLSVGNSSDWHTPRAACHPQ